MSTHDKDKEQIDSANPIPMPEEGGHARSHAAHLHGAGGANNKGAGVTKHSSSPGALRQPPAEPSRSGKQHR